MAENRQDNGAKQGAGQEVTEREMELAKMYQDSFKHMVTFSSAAIVAVATVAGTLFLPQGVVGIVLLAESFFLFALSITAANLGLYYVHRSLERAHWEESVHSSWVDRIFFGMGMGLGDLVYLGLSIIFAYLGVVSFAGYVFFSLIIR